MSLISDYFPFCSMIVSIEQDTKHLSEFDRDCLIVTTRYKQMGCSMLPHQTTQTVRDLNDFLQSE